MTAATGAYRADARPAPSRVLAPLVGIVFAVFLGLPVVALLARAVFGGRLETAVSEPVLDALALSLATTAIALAATLILGTPLAWALARRRFRGQRLVETIVDLPIVLPPSVAGLALLLVLGRRGPVGGPLDAIGLDIAFTTVAVVLAQVFVAAPFYVRTARAGFASVHRDLEDAARIDGGGEWAVFRHVTVPLSQQALVAGGVLAWARALGEFGATIMFAGNVAGVTQTLPLVVYAEFQSSLEASIAAAAMLVLAAFGALLVVRLVHWRPGEELTA
jgi:molybdate transport system permease protein